MTTAPTPRSERPDMAAYGVPTEREGALPWEWASQRLTTCRNFWVISVNDRSPSEVRPHAMPVWGVWMEQTQRFWFSCAPTSAKHRNLLGNPHVTIAASDTVEVLTIEGVALQVNEGRDAAVSAYGLKYAEPDKRAELEAFMMENAIWQVRPVRAFAIIEREEEFAAKATRWVWE
jgi:hypothetical protein